MVVSVNQYSALAPWTALESEHSYHLLSPTFISTLMATFTEDQLRALPLHSLPHCSHQLSDMILAMFLTDGISDTTLNVAL